ncbi:MAG: response regulator [Sporichthyaceae bacterium]
MSAVRVLVVEDEEIAAAAHTAYVQRVPGFEVAGTARSGAEAVRVLRTAAVDLVLLDMNLPDLHGLELLRRIRAEGHRCDVLAVTAARDLAVVREAVSSGVVLYLLKPFTFASFRAKLEQYAAYLEQLHASDERVAQQDVDQIFGRLRTDASAGPAKGLSAETLALVTSCVRAADGPLSALEVAERTGASRVTVRRYLEHLAAGGVLERRNRYGRSGRPEVEYAWRS